MKRMLHLRLSAILRKYAVPYLACSWILGLIFGLWVISSAPADLSYTNDFFRRYTPVSMISVSLFPVLVSFLVVFAERSWVLLVISFLKAFGFAYTSCLVTRGYGSAGWLIRFLVMFSDCISLPFLWWFWCQLLKGRLKISVPMVFSVSVPAIAIGILDIQVISPFLSTLQILQKG